MFSEEDVLHAINSVVELGSYLKKIKGGSFPTDLLSTFGELKVFLELKKRFPNCDVGFKRKARADISLDSANIEVKTSNLKKRITEKGMVLRYISKNAKYILTLLLSIQGEAKLKVISATLII